MARYRADGAGRWLPLRRSRPEAGSIERNMPLGSKKGVLRLKGDDSIKKKKKKKHKELATSGDAADTQKPSVELLASVLRICLEPFRAALVSLTTLPAGAGNAGGRISRTCPRKSRP